ncbi:hypothetical protein TNCV_1583961 [Trichonephila clavipes]|nr:hypothetical protein TNCV_1583961 [Trichonephila clavipes]
MYTTTEITDCPFSNKHSATLMSGCGSPVVKVSNHGRHVMSSIPVPLKRPAVDRAAMHVKSVELKRPPVGVVW